MFFLVSIVKYTPCHIPLKYRCPIKTRDHIWPTYLSHLTSHYFLFNIWLLHVFVITMIDKPLHGNSHIDMQRDLALYEKCGPYVLTLFNLVNRGQKHATYLDTYIGVVHGKFVVKNENLDDILWWDWTMFSKHINNSMLNLLIERGRPPWSLNEEK